MMHVICRRLSPGHLTVLVGDSSRRSEVVKKKSRLRLSMRLVLVLLLLSLILLSLSLLLLLLLVVVVLALRDGESIYCCCILVT